MKKESDCKADNTSEFLPIVEVVPTCEDEEISIPSVETVPEPEPEPEILSKVDVPTAQAMFTDSKVNQMVYEASMTDIRYGEDGMEAIVNVDTLSEHFDDGDEITIAVLKSEKLISPKAKRIKILARGELTKKITVIADSYSADAAKMLIAVGGQLIQLHKRGQKK